MKNKLINILNQCIFNKSFNDYKKVEKFIITLQNYDIIFNNIENIVYDVDDEFIFISFWTTYNDNRKLISVMFNSDNYITISQICGCEDVLFNCSYNIQYDDIKKLLLK